MDLMFFETSAKSGTNIKTLFYELAKKLTGFDTGNVDEGKNEENVKQGFSLDGNAQGGAADKDGKNVKDKKKKKCC
eukprot:CAMPEP_0176385148 /NCGR_PEP_ID=MMETSP0126-20121128/34906_1 /TAXON_ID=141414 ORGANISM="Strombidinopsis acuminatum, Strain SPMC142" /NCGR_SAMPLE_ID=MMETSP0126 /ASSEMBLY_ACC=CAM_ASM_000229 /LENGTH=75 /DNA_ID=CAMNT_0017751311 /DNA_START=482 /DNA_END=709 /DNA_ORIENTATION=+